MSEVNRETQIEGIRGQLHDWQHNLAVRVAGEAQALDVEIDKLYDNEFDEVWEVIRTVRQRLFAATDTLRSCGAASKSGHRHDLSIPEEPAG